MNPDSVVAVREGCFENPAKPFRPDLRGEGRKQRRGLAKKKEKERSHV
jgi:hypothetical protein